MFVLLVLYIIYYYTIISTTYNIYIYIYIYSTTHIYLYLSLYYYHNSYRVITQRTEKTTQYLKMFDESINRKDKYSIAGTEEFCARPDVLLERLEYIKPWGNCWVLVDLLLFRYGFFLDF